MAGFENCSNAVFVWWAGNFDAQQCAQKLPGHPRPLVPESFGLQA
jgi:hypothetical protein